MSTREVNRRAQESLQIGFSYAYESCGVRLSLNFSYCVAPRIWFVNCEWDIILESNVSCSAELAASLQTFSAVLGRHCVHICSVNVTR